MLLKGLIVKNVHTTIAKAVALVAMISASSLAAAGGNTTVQVDAKVSGVCKFISTTSSGINLGTIDPSAVAAAGVTNSSDVLYNCTKGLTPSVTIATGGTTLTGLTPANMITYAFTLGTPQVGAGFSNAAGGSKVVATATIAQLDAQNAPADTYKDIVTLTISN